MLEVIKMHGKFSASINFKFVHVPKFHHTYLYLEKNCGVLITSGNIQFSNIFSRGKKLYTMNRVY